VYVIKPKARFPNKSRIDTTQVISVSATIKMTKHSILINIVYVIKPKARFPNNSQIDARKVILVRATI